MASVMPSLKKLDYDGLGQISLGEKSKQQEEFDCGLCRRKWVYQLTHWERFYRYEIIIIEVDLE